MTDGTSQGLFIVVAIVIFGIFVVLAYILFEDMLSPAMANMFSEATEQASERATPYTNEKYFEFDKSTGTISGFKEEYATDYPQNLRIPPRIEGVKVKIIGNSAFSGLSFDEVFIGNSVETIGKESFHNASISKLDLGSTVKTIQNSAFYNDDREEIWVEIRDLYIPNSVELIDSSAFNNRSITTITGGRGLQRINHRAFENAMLIGTLELPNIKVIENEAFRDSKLDTIIVPNSASLDAGWTRHETQIIRK